MWGLRDLTRFQAPRFLIPSVWSSVVSRFRFRCDYAGGESQPTTVPLEAVDDTLKVARLIRLFRSRGHLAAQLDPLKRTPRGPWLSEDGSEGPRDERSLLALLEGYPESGTVEERAAYVGKRWNISNPYQQFYVGNEMPGTGSRSQPMWWSLPSVVELMSSLYCGPLSVELSHLFTDAQQRWLVQRFEARGGPPPPAARARLLHDLVRADEFERFLSRKFPASKRFGLEGCEALLPGLWVLMERSAGHGVRHVEVGMSHRGRLNVLANVLGKPMGALCSEMEGKQSAFHVGDVKYHLGQSATVSMRPPMEGLEGGEAAAGKPGPPLHVAIAPNPSHLEAVNPVVLGMVRALQTELGDTRGRRVMAVLIHGDAAFAGQGALAECMQLSAVPGFRVGGTVHVVVNNQVGFTTVPRQARSSPHPTDVAKAVGAPILHVNADHPDALWQAMRLASDWRAVFGVDVVVDLVGYRRNGHNELDDPATTLPLTYAAIAQHPPVAHIYAQQLQAEGVVSAAEVDAWRCEVRSEYEREFEAAQRGEYTESAAQFLASSWQGDALQALDQEAGPHSVTQEPTGLPLPTLRRVGAAMCAAPAGFTPHAEVAQLMSQRLAMVQSADSRVDFAMAEALAFGTLMLHGTPEEAPSGASASSPEALGSGLNRGYYAVRLTGQDVERGTFNQRHAVIYDQRTGERRVGLNHVAPGRQEVLEVWNSPLCEASALGFEYGYALGAKGRGLVLWEAQFGDFANNAQVVIDQFIVSGEAKWGQQCGLVVLLPHGHDGQGPDHSSARLERWLAAVDDDADSLPGNTPAHRRAISDTFAAITRDMGGRLGRQQALELMRSLGGDGRSGELVEVLWAEMGLPEDQPIGLRAWQGFMRQYMRRCSERDTNLFIACPTTPAQYFHALRRQMNLPYKKPLVLFTSKFLLHHKPATSALADLASGTFFNRVIDDSKASDNTRHLARHPVTGAPFLLPPHEIRRVLLCSGQIYYRLSAARRAARVRDVVLVRLEQLAPFPHDLITRVIGQYGAAELVWCQEEPKNMGAWGYVRPRLEAALREHCEEAVGGEEARKLRYVGRRAAAVAATASFAIHQREMQEIVDAALA